MSLAGWGVAGYKSCHPHPCPSGIPSPCDARKASLQGEGKAEGDPSERNGYLVRHNSEQNFVSVCVEVVTMPDTPVRLGFFFSPSPPQRSVAGRGGRG